MKEGIIPPEAILGTTAGARKGHICLYSGTPISYDYIKSEGSKGRLGKTLLCIVANGPSGRVYLSPRIDQEYSFDEDIWNIYS